ncbi:MAG: pyrroline-5-carboxylate reductase, partial [Clostridia bacterium]|nr:pyrroline-5-carboxylate reductase [Clostridia bacterium]
AGITYNGIKKYFPNANVTRVMPNTPCKLKKGMTAIRKNDSIPQEEKEFVKSIFDSIGKTIYLEEDLFHAVTAVSGSGPAYVYMFIEGMIESGIKMGMSPEDAKTCVLQTFAGSIGMVETETAPISDLINAVCSKGGTTIQAVDSFKQDNLYEIIDSAMIKCRNRSEELGK